MTKKELLRMIESKEVELQEVNDKTYQTPFPSTELHELLDIKDHIINELHALEVMFDREDYEDDPPDEESEADEPEPDHVLEDEECRR